MEDNKITHQIRKGRRKRFSIVIFQPLSASNFDSLLLLNNKGGKFL